MRVSRRRNSRACRERSRAVVVARPFATTSVRSSACSPGTSSSTRSCSGFAPSVRRFVPHHGRGRVDRPQDHAPAPARCRQRCPARLDAGAGARRAGCDAPAVDDRPPGAVPQHSLCVGRRLSLKGHDWESGSALVATEPKRSRRRSSLQTKPVRGPARQRPTRAPANSATRERRRRRRRRAWR